MVSLLSFAPHVQNHLEIVLKHGRLGLCPGPIRISNVKPSCCPYLKNAKCDRFKMTIPYGGHSISWDVLFQARHSEFAPDLIFPDCNFNMQLEEVESLCSWNPKDITGLLKITKELVGIYKKKQIALLKNYNFVYFEYSALMQKTDFTDDDVEVFISQKNRNGPISFLIQLPVQFPKIPPLITQDNPDEDSALLLITYQTPEGNKVTPHLFLSPKVEHVLGGAHAWKIPNIPNDSSLVDYVPSVTDLLSKKVQQVIHSFHMRKEYILTFLIHFGRSIIEYDAESFLKMVLLFEWNDFYFILHVNLPLNFPAQKPCFTFQSIYHSISGKPVSINFSDYPYSPRWSAHEMLERTRCFLLEYVPVFQRSSIKSRR